MTITIGIHGNGAIPHIHGIRGGGIRRMQAITRIIHLIIMVATMVVITEDIMELITEAVNIIKQDQEVVIH